MIAGVDGLIARRFADAEQSFGAFGVGVVLLRISLQALKQKLHFGGRGLAGSSQTEPIRDAVLRCRAAIVNHALAELACRLDKCWIVQEIQRLKRSVGPTLPHRAELTPGRIEYGHGRRWGGALPENIQP